jgi:polyphosphate kinase 2 (PPK2 family)
LHSLEHAAMSRLDELDLTLKLTRREEDRHLAVRGARLQQLRLELAGLTGPGSLGPPLLVLFEGWDASGKGGAIKRLVEPLDPRHVRVKSYAAPTADEKRHHFLHRFNAALPGWGGMAVLDRTWYGRVLVERVEGYATEAEWRRAYRQINQWEESLVQEGTILVKFWLHTSSEEQHKRFERRADDPLKMWKLTDDDWRNRLKRDVYLEAIDDMLEHTDVPTAPWTLVEGESKRYARVKVMDTVIEAIETGCAERGFELPEPLGRDAKA